MKRKCFALIVSVVMALGLMGGVVAGGSGVDGQFTGRATGFIGPIELQITVEDGRITEIEYLEFDETMVLVEVAMRRIPDQIIEHQSLAVDFVTGVTVTSFAIVAAVTQAAQEAGLDVAQLRRNPVNIESRGDIVMETDVLVLGGGGAGFAAAITAAGEGVDVVLLEKASVLGGNTMMAGNAYNAVNPAAQANLTLSRAQYAAMNAILDLTSGDAHLHFDLFPEWEHILYGVQDDIRAHFETNAGTEPGVDMPSFDSINLHLWHTYTGGLRQLLDGSWIAPDYAQARIMVEGSLDTFIWLYHTAGFWTDYNPTSLRAVVGALWMRTHGFMVQAERFPALRATAEDLGVSIYTDTRATELIVNDNGAVIGARAVDLVDGTSITVYAANGVVLATGGFGDNNLMIMEFDNYWGDILTPTILSTNKGTLMGDGIVMAGEIGAALTADMAAVQFLPGTSVARGLQGNSMPGAPGAESSIQIDARGNRFVNEYAERDLITKAALELDEGFYFILSGGPSIEPGNHLAPSRGIRYDNAMVQTLLRRELAWWGSTLEELAAATHYAADGVVANFTEEILRATILRYNAAVVNQYDPDFGKPVLAGYIDIDYIEANPEVGFGLTPRAPAIHHTMGGVLIDTDMRVIHLNGNPIPGLWAAGEVVGGTHAGNRLGGNALPEAFVFGRIAGYNAANGN